MSGTAGQSCATCRFFLRDMSATRHICCAHPPRATFVPEIGVLSFQPETDMNAWCGEYQNRAGK